jgi:hypothetical protein
MHKITGIRYEDNSGISYLFRYYVDNIVIDHILIPENEVPDNFKRYIID